MSFNSKLRIKRIGKKHGHIRLLQTLDLPVI